MEMVLTYAVPGRRFPRNPHAVPALEAGWHACNGFADAVGFVRSDGAAPGFRSAIAGVDRWAPGGLPGSVVGVA